MIVPNYFGDFLQHVYSYSVAKERSLYYKHTSPSNQGSSLTKISSSIFFRKILSVKTVMELLAEVHSTTEFDRKALQQTYKNISMAKKFIGVIKEKEKRRGYKSKVEKSTKQEY